MKRLLCLGFIALALAVPSQLPAGNVPSGNWQLTLLAPMGSDENTNWLFKIETAEGKSTASILASIPAGKQAAKVEVDSLKMDGDKVRMVLKGPGEQVFEGRMMENGKKIVGVFNNGKSFIAAYMAPTTAESLDAKSSKKKLTVTPEELKTWAEVAKEFAKEHGPRATMEVGTQFATAFLAQKKSELAAQFALGAEKAIPEAAPADLRIKILQTAARALQEAGNHEELAAVGARLEKLERVLDKEYHAAVPPFKGKPFMGRKSQNDRVVVMELFTGAQCPPCVAADVAFDVLGETYRPSELALIQYHLHIPGADPMTNADTEERAKYYKASSTPSTFFNGSKQASGGGGMDAAEKKFGAYRAVIDPLLEKPAGCKVFTWAKQAGDKIQIHTAVAGLDKPGDSIKLRLVLVEDHVRFVGSNKLRFHHQVVRAMPGGVSGVSVTSPVFANQTEVDLPALRQKLTKYLDNYNLVGARAPFPQISRPMEMDHLSVIAFVQNDSTQEILQAAQVHVVR